MLSVLRRISALLLLGVMGLFGCVSTTLQTDWRDPGFSGSFKKVVVICMVKEMVVRNTLEDDLAAQFTRRGIVAVPSYTLFTSLRDVDRDMVKRKVREIDADGVLLVRLVGKESIPLNTSNYSAAYNYYDQWGAFSQQAYGGSQAASVDMYRVETSLYEAGQGKIVWQALSDTYEDGPWMETLKFFADLMGKKLIQHGLI